MPLVLIVVAVEAQQFPVTAVGRVVVVIVILVMDSKLPKPFAAEFPSAPRADRGENFERPFTVGFLELFPVAAGLGYNIALPALIGLCFDCCHACILDSSGMEHTRLFK